MSTGIEWTDEVWNPVTGCTKVSAGCQHCYAERMAKRLKGRHGYPADDPFRVTLRPDRLGELDSWHKPRMVFVCSMGDLFHEDVPTEFILHVFQLMQLRHRHTYQVLTKRPERAAEFMAGREPLPNVWLGTSVENQAAADERIPHLLKTPAAVRFLSCEPLLGPVDLLKPMGWYVGPPTQAHGMHQGADWVICGGESGPGARPMHPDWARSLRDQCGAAGVPYFFKQWGEWGGAGMRHAGERGNFAIGDPLGRFSYVDVYPRQFQMFGCSVMKRVGKKRAGRLLDGQEWNQMPEAKA